MGFVVTLASPFHLSVRNPVGTLTAWATLDEEPRRRINVPFEDGVGYPAWHFQANCWGYATWQQGEE